MRIRIAKVSIIMIFTLTFVLFSVLAPNLSRASAGGGSQTDQQLSALLAQQGFTGRIDSALEAHLGRQIDNQLADLGRNLFFDTVGGLNNDNNCAGCHVPSAGFGDTQSIAIGIDNNGIVGPNRTGPRNQRRTPSIVNTAVYPTLMWNSRFHAVSRDPFDNSQGFLFPPPEGVSLSYLPHLLTAQAFIPPTERVEVAGFDFPGDSNDIRAEVLRRINDVHEYRKRFGKIFPSVRSGGPITFDMFGAAIAEFEFTQVFADAPIDRYARGQQNAMTADQKKGALLFFGTANCVACHKVSGDSNEMFSDFDQHAIGVPQVVPSVGNVVFDGPGQNEDFGLEQVTGNPDDRYKFRTSPLRNVALQPTFFHNGAVTTLEDAVRHHLNVFASAQNYSPAAAGLDADLQGPTGPIAPVLLRLDPMLSQPINLTEEEFRQLVAFLRFGLLDPRARPERLRLLIPREVPSGMPVLVLSRSFWNGIFRDPSFWPTYIGLPTGDVRTDISVFRPSENNWYLDEIAIYRSGQWWVLDLFDNQASWVNFGSPADKPVPADFDGDGLLDQAVYRSSEWHLNRSGRGYTAVSFGLPSDRPLTGDFDGDRKADLGSIVMARGISCRARMDSPSSNGVRLVTSALADYDGDGKTAIAVFPRRSMVSGQEHRRKFSCPLWPYGRQAYTVRLLILNS